MAKINILEELTKENPGARRVNLLVYANALESYFEALINIKDNGVICSHPRTGVPIDNPYLKIQERQGAVLTKMTKEARIKSDRVVKLLEKENGI